MTEMRLVFLGTGGGMPSTSRGLPALALRYAGGVMLFDCGEGTQRQFIKSRLGFKQNFTIFITHMHGDHVLGLPGLLYTMSMLDREAPVDIYGPRGLAEYLETVISHKLGALTFPVRVYTVSPSLTIERGSLSIRCVPADHVIESYCYVVQERDRPGKMNVEYLERLGVPRGPLWGRLQRGQPIHYRGRIITPEEALGPRRRGRKIVYTGDTRPCESIINAAQGADVLIHDSTFNDDMLKKAVEDGHSTARQAAEVAAQAGVKLLYLYHISPRYEGDAEILLREARTIFSNTYLAEDLMSYSIPYPED